MQCPVCQVELRMADRQGIEIDYCPQCRGVWLDRGELDKILERSAASTPEREPDYRQPEYRQPGYREPDYRPYERPRYEEGGYHQRRKRKSFLDDLFDFD